VSVLAQPHRELPDRRRLARPVDADDEDHGGPFVDIEGPGFAEQLRQLVDQRSREVGDVAALFEPPNHLRRRGNADVGGDERLLEPLPRRLVGRVEDGGLELLRQRAP
jgi:hypothetical protein